MLQSYPAKYRDATGEETTVILNNGAELEVTLRGVRFVGTMLDDFEPSVIGDPEVLNTFVIHCGMLCDCVFEWEMPIAVVRNGGVIEGRLHCHLELGKPRGHDCGIDKDKLQVSLHCAGAQITSFDNGVDAGWFDIALEAIQKQLPLETYIKCCHSCALSHYSPAGFGLFGKLGCFRGHKEAVRRAKFKPEIFALYRQGVTQMVQETYLCPEFERATRK